MEDAKAGRRIEDGIVWGFNSAPEEVTFCKDLKDSGDCPNIVQSPSAGSRGGRCKGPEAENEPGSRMKENKQ